MEGVGGGGYVKIDEEMIKKYQILAFCGNNMNHPHANFLTLNDLRLNYANKMEIIFHALHVTPTFLCRNRFYSQLPPQCPKMNKKSMWEVKKNSRFLSLGHRILPSCGCQARETIVAKYELVL